MQEHVDAVKEAKVSNKKSKDSLWEALYKINSNN